MLESKVKSKLGHLQGKFGSTIVQQGGLDLAATKKHKGLQCKQTAVQIPADLRCKLGLTDIIPGSAPSVMLPSLPLPVRLGAIVDEVLLGQQSVVAETHTEVGDVCLVDVVAIWPRFPVGLVHPMHLDLQLPIHFLSVTA